MSEKGMIFTLTSEQVEKFETWAKEQDEKVAAKQKKPYPNYGACGGAYKFTFIPTSLGEIVKVHNSMTKETLDLSEGF